MLRHWLNKVARAAAARRHRDSVRPALETLEDRCLLSFGAPIIYGSSGGSYAVVAGDVNNDGNLDLVKTDTNDDAVSVLLGNGDGTFQTPLVYPTGPGPRSLAVADLNNDGNLDIVTANYNSSTASVLLGNGDGTFRSLGETPAGVLNPLSVAVADFNLDGHPDVVAVDYAGLAGLLLGNGDGTFQVAQNFTAGTALNWVTTGDFNNDGAPDLATAHVGRGWVYVLLNNNDWPPGPPGGGGLPAYAQPADVTPSPTTLSRPLGTPAAGDLAAGIAAPVRPAANLVWGGTGCQPAPVAPDVPFASAPDLLFSARLWGVEGIGG